MSEEKPKRREFKVPIVFTLSDFESNKINRVLGEHADKCALYGPATADWFGSPYRFVIIPSSGLGHTVILKCNCGWEEDVSDHTNPDYMP